MKDLSSVGTSTATEIAAVLEVETDKAKKAYKAALAEGDLEAAQLAWCRYGRVDDRRIQFSRCLESVKDLLATAF